MLPHPLTPTLFPYTTLFRSSSRSPCLFCGKSQTYNSKVSGKDEGPPQLLDRAKHWWNPQHRSKSVDFRSEEHTSELQSLRHLVCRLLLEKKKKKKHKEDKKT